ncbi:MAG: hypothetical protein ACLFUJ_02945 [Phycisphaerae bacterium]
MSEPASQNLQQTPPEAPEAPGPQRDPIESIQQENQQLRQRIEALQDKQSQLDQQAEKLESDRQANSALRRRCSELELRAQLDRAAESVGISPQVAHSFAHRFETSIDAEGKVTIQPNPTETLLGELRSNPLLKASQDSRRQTAAAAAPDQAQDPAALLAMLDRNPARKAEFISRHGTEALLKLAGRCRKRRS